MRFNCFSFHRACWLAWRVYAAINNRVRVFPWKRVSWKTKVWINAANEANLLHVVEFVNATVYSRHFISHCQLQTRMCAHTRYIARTTPRVFICLIPTYATWTCRERKLFFHTWRTRHTYASHISCVTCFLHWPTRTRRTGKHDPTGL